MGADDEAGEEINQEDVWEVISAYFDEKGLVRQQLDSFDEFIMNTMQEIVDECSTLHLVPQQQHNPLMQASGAKSYKITFGQIYLSKPTWVEPDQTTSAMFPNEARLRNLTYAAPLYMDLTQTTRTEDPDDPDGAADEEKQQLDKVFLGQVPIMRRSTYCILKDSNDRELTDLGARRKHAGRCAGERPAGCSVRSAAERACWLSNSKPSAPPPGCVSPGAEGCEEGPRRGPAPALSPILHPSNSCTN